MRALLLSVVTILGLAGSAAAAATPTFGPERTLARSAPFGPQPTVAMNTDGRSVVAWVGDPTRAGGRVVARRGSPAGRFGRAQTLSGRPISDVAAAVAPDGTAAVAWYRVRRGGRRFLEVAVAAPGHRFGGPQRIVSVVANVHSVNVVATQGRLVAVWWQGVPGTGGHEVRYAIASGRKGFGKPRTLARTGVTGGVDAAAALGGSVVAAWHSGPAAGVNGQAVAAVLRPNSTRFGRIEVLSAGTAYSIPGSQAHPSGVFAGAGGVAVGFSVLGSAPWRLEAAQMAPDGTFAPATQIAAIETRDGLATYGGPELALPVADYPVAAWTQGRVQGAENAQVSSGELMISEHERRVQGTWGPPARLSTPGVNAENPATTATGDAAIVAWSEPGRVRFAVRPAGGVFMTADLSPRGGIPVLAAGGSRAIAVWRNSGRVRAALLG